MEPLKPGKAEVTLGVTSYIKTGADKEPVPIRVLQDTWQVGALGRFGIKGFKKDKPDFET